MVDTSVDIDERLLVKFLEKTSAIPHVVQVISMISEEELYITGGIIRNTVWNLLHDKAENFGINDCDVIFYNTSNTSKEHEKTIELKLKKVNSSIKWNVKNQARMHIRNGHQQYQSIFDAVSHFPETASAIAIDKDWSVIAPYGVDDLLKLKLKPTFFCQENEELVFYTRLLEKQWPISWPKLDLGKLPAKCLTKR